MNVYIAKKNSKGIVTVVPFDADFNDVDFAQFDGVAVEGLEFVNPQAALQHVQASQGQYFEGYQLFKLAVANILADAEIRQNGHRMAAKFSGTDVATGRAFSAGTEIFYCGGINGGTVIA